jgi:hypothetical protein
LDGYLQFDVHTLHLLPVEIAEIAYETLEWIDCALVKALMPYGTWDGGETGGLGEDMREEYLALVAAGALTGDLAAAMNVAKRERFLHFEGDAEAFSEQIERAQKMYDMRPPWMRDRTLTDMPRRLALLQERAARAPNTPGCRAWADFVTYTCSVLAGRFKSPKKRRPYQTAQRALELILEEAEVPFYFGLWVNSGSEPESYNCEVLFDRMSETGERPTERYDLSTMSSTQLLRELDNTAIGIGLLIRASQTNDHLTREQR